MFEGKLPSLPAARGASASPAEGDSLREVSWSDLRARLEAARDLRSSLSSAGREALASFDAPFARRIAELEDGKGVVNPSDLANGKGTWPIDGVSQDAGFGSAPRN